MVGKLTGKRPQKFHFLHHGQVSGTKKKNKLNSYDLHQCQMAHLWYPTFIEALACPVAEVYG